MIKNFCFAIKNQSSWRLAESQNECHKISRRIYFETYEITTRLEPINKSVRMEFSQLEKNFRHSVSRDWNPWQLSGASARVQFWQRDGQSFRSLARDFFNELLKASRMLAFLALKFNAFVLISHCEFISYLYRLCFSLHVQNVFTYFLHEFENKEIYKFGLYKFEANTWNKCMRVFFIDLTFCHSFYFVQRFEKLNADQSKTIYKKFDV